MTLEGARDAARRELGEVVDHGAPLATIGHLAIPRWTGRPCHYRPFKEADTRSGTWIRMTPDQATKTGHGERPPEQAECWPSPRAGRPDRLRGGCRKAKLHQGGRQAGHVPVGAEPDRPPRREPAGAAPVDEDHPQRCAHGGGRTPFAHLGARAVIATWRQDYNEVRPHSSLSKRTPAEFAATLRDQGTLAANHPSDMLAN